jgi:hypothetical protein
MLKDLTAASTDELLYEAAIMTAKLEQPFCSPDHWSCKNARTRLATLNAELKRRSHSPGAEPPR